MRTSRGALTLVELLVVLAIIAALLGLLFPAVQGARARARESTCKNNLHQMNVALGQYCEAGKRLPPPSTPGTIDGWVVELLPFLEEQSTYDRLPRGAPVTDAPADLLIPPVIMHCPVRSVLEDERPKDGRKGRGPGDMASAHYVLVIGSGRDTCSLYDAPVHLQAPWAEGPEMAHPEMKQGEGPHRGGYFRAALFQGVEFVNARDK